MEIMTMRHGLAAFCVLAALWFAGCQTGTAPAGTNQKATTENTHLAPRRVDIRGSILVTRYDQGQVVLEVEGIRSPESRYNRAYVLVTPITQIIGIDGQPISLSELRQGQSVAILMRNGGQGNFVGVGVARKVWVEDTF